MLSLSQISRKFGSVYSDKGQASVDVYVTAVLVFLLPLLSQAITSITAAELSPALCHCLQAHSCSFPLVSIDLFKTIHINNVTAHQWADSRAVLNTTFMASVRITQEYLTLGGWLTVDGRQGGERVQRLCWDGSFILQFIPPENSIRDAVTTTYKHSEYWTQVHQYTIKTWQKHYRNINRWSGWQQCWATKISYPDDDTFSVN